MVKLIKSVHVNVLLVVVALLLVGYLLTSYLGGASSWIETMTSSKKLGADMSLKTLAGGPTEAKNTMSNKYIMGGDLNPSELLPTGGLGQAWSKTNPVGLGQLDKQNFLDAKHHFGIDTVGQSHRNTTYDLRAEPVVPKRMVSPWNNSTIEQDTLRRGLGDFGCTKALTNFNVKPATSV